MVEVLGEKLGLELVDEGGATAIEVDGLPLILQQANDDLLLIHADLGEMAPECREGIMSAAMEANYLYQGTGGATLSVNPRDGHLHLQKYNYLERLDAEKGFELLERFAQTLQSWRNIIADYKPSQQGTEAPLDVGGFMQV